MLHRGHQYVHFSLYISTNAHLWYHGSAEKALIEQDIYQWRSISVQSQRQYMHSLDHVRQMERRPGQLLIELFNQVQLPLQSLDLPCS